MSDEESVLRNRLLEDIVNKEGEDGGDVKKGWQPDNLMVLYVTAALFGGFVIAEIVGALVSIWFYISMKSGDTSSHCLHFNRLHTGRKLAVSFGRCICHDR